MRSRRGWWPVLVVVLCAYGLLGLLGLRSCLFDPYTEALDTKLGVSRLGAGQFAVQILLCPGEHVRDVMLSEPDPAHPSADITLWEVRAMGRSDATQFVVGSPPAGYVTVRSAVTRQLSDQPLYFGVTTRDGIFYSINFTPADALAGRVYVPRPSLLDWWRGVHVTPARYKSMRPAVCRIRPTTPHG